MWGRMRMSPTDEVTRQFAPYVGIDWSRAVGRTADLAAPAGDDAAAISLVAGVRFWF